MFDQMKTAFKKMQSKEVTADASVESKPSTAVSVDLGDALLQAGSAAVVPAASTVPVIDCGTFESAEPQLDPIEEKVLAFLRICHLTSGLTFREVAGGTALPIAEAKRALESLVANGTVKHSGEPEPNYRRYSLTAPEPEAPAPPVDRRSKEQRWSDEAAAKQRAADEALKPKPQPRYQPTADEVQAALDAEEARRKAIVFTPEEREYLRRMEGRVPINPQSVIVKPKRS
jgi:hypothetical protein